MQTLNQRYRISAVLYQDINNTNRVISYSSAKLTEAQQKYKINKCVAIISAIKRYRPYLEDHRFTLRIGNATLQWLQTLKYTKAELT